MSRGGAGVIRCGAPRKKPRVIGERCGAFLSTAEPGQEFLRVVNHSDERLPGNQVIRCSECKRLVELALPSEVQRAAAA